MFIEQSHSLILCRTGLVSNELIDSLQSSIYMDGPRKLLPVFLFFKCVLKTTKKSEKLIS